MERYTMLYGGVTLDYFTQLDYFANILFAEIDQRYTTFDLTQDTGELKKFRKS